MEVLTYLTLFLFPTLRPVSSVFLELVKHTSFTGSLFLTLECLEFSTPNRHMVDSVNSFHYNLSKWAFPPPPPPDTLSKDCYQPGSSCPTGSSKTLRCRDFQQRELIHTAAKQGDGRTHLKSASLRARGSGYWWHEEWRSSGPRCREHGEGGEKWLEKGVVIIVLRRHN